MPQTFFDGEGKEVEAVSLEDAQKLQEERDQLIKERDELAAEKARREEGDKDKDENFNKLRTKLETTESALAETNRKISEKEEYERKTVKEALFSQYAGDDADARKKLEDEYAVINIDESNPENIAQRMEKAARVSGLYKEEVAQNPIFRSFYGGGAPNLKPVKPAGDDPDNILNTEKGKGALAAMGIPTEEPTK